MKERIGYVDAMRAFAIISVVVAHLNYFSFDNCNSIFDQCITAFFMPLFFFISGMFAKNEISIKLLSKRTYQLILPFCTMGCIMCWHHGLPLSELFCTFHHAGYWFLLALYWMHILYMFTQIVASSFSERNKLIAELGTTVVVWIGLNIVLGFHILPTAVEHIFCVRHLVKLFPFFFFGKYYMQYGQMMKGNVREIMVAISIIGFCVMLFMEHYYQVSFNMYLRILYGILGVIGILQVFTNLSKRVVENRVVTYIGQHTLEIYLLHYFFLPSKEVVLQYPYSFTCRMLKLGGGYLSDYLYIICNNNHFCMFICGMVLVPK